MRLLPPRLEPIRTAYERVMDADPFLMSAAIAYNAFFALVPLAFATVAALSVFGADLDTTTELEKMIANGFPKEVGEFIIDIVTEAHDSVGDLGTTVLIVSLLVALWSGSRAIYAVQKALRLMQHAEEHRPYWKTRGLGILFTFGAGIALVVGYVIVIFGGWLAEALKHFGLPVGSVTWITGAVMFGWVMVVLYAIYEWGTPDQIRRPFTSALVATTVLTITTLGAAAILPELSGGTVAAVGSVGVILVWAYVIGLVVIISPAVVAAVEAVARGTGE